MAYNRACAQVGEKLGFPGDGAELVPHRGRRHRAQQASVLVDVRDQRVERRSSSDSKQGLRFWVIGALAGAAPGSLVRRPVRLDHR